MLSHTNLSNTLGIAETNISLIVCDVNVLFAEKAVDLKESRIRPQKIDFDYLIDQYSKCQNKINQYSKDKYDDNYKIKAIKNTKLEVYQEMLNMLEFAIKEYTDVDISKIEIQEFHVLLPTVCQMDRSKICNGCMNC
jgi:hypothetical protein